MHGKCSLSLAIRKIQIKIMRRYYLTKVRMATLTKIRSNKGCQTFKEKKCYMPWQRYKFSILSHQNTKNRSLPWSRDPYLCIHPKNVNSLLQRRICTPRFTVVLFTAPKIQNQHRCSSADEWINKVYMYTILLYCPIIKMKSCHFQKMNIELETSFQKMLTSLIWSYNSEYHTLLQKYA